MRDIGQKADGGFSGTFSTSRSPEPQGRILDNSFFLDRAFYADFCGGGNRFMLKPAGRAISARRAGTTAAWDQMNKYFGLRQMPIITSRYWNMVHGATPEEVRRDTEGMQIMRILGKNMAYFLKRKEAGSKAGVSLPGQEAIHFTNFIRESFSSRRAARSIRTTEEHPLGVYHPHVELHHIKKENIGLIEVMGLAVLPARLKEELTAVAEDLVSGGDLRSSELTEKHSGWAESFRGNYRFTRDNALNIVQRETGLVFAQVLEHAGVYKRNHIGKQAFWRR